ncbi:MAG: histidine phosphatase family protein [Burkholderiaceae bacterium]
MIEQRWRERGLRALVAFALAAVSPIVAGNEALWTLLRAGGQVVLMRHAETTPGVGDPAGMRLDECATQRNLNDEGRRQSEQVGRAFRERGVAVARVLSSPWCRCLETARIAFGPPTTEQALSNLFGRSDPSGAQVTALAAIVGERRGTANWVLVSHGSTIQALTGVSPGFAEFVVVTPQGNGKFTLAGRVPLEAR